MFVSKRLREAELAFLNAPFRTDGWLLALQQLAALTGSTLAQFCTAGGPSVLPFNLFSDERHDPHGHLHNPELYGTGNWRINTTVCARTINFDPDYAAYRDRHDTSRYDDAVNDLDLPFGCQSALLFDSDGLTGLALLRSSRDGPCSADTLAGFSRLAGQAHRAVRVQLALGEEAAALMVDGPAGLTDRTILLDRFCRVLALTLSAELMLDGTSGVRMSGDQLVLAHPAESRELLASFGRLLASDGVTGPVLHECQVGRCSAHPEGRWRLVIVRLPGDMTSFTFEPRLALTLTPLSGGGEPDQPSITTSVPSVVRV